MSAWFRRCIHERVRCIHGDEIIATTRAWRRPSWARVRCLDCGRALYGRPLPEPCSKTDMPHSHRTIPEPDSPASDERND